MKCPKCQNSTNLMTERRIDGFTTCLSCNFRAKTAVFNAPTPESTGITKAQLRAAKKNILKCLTVDFEYGKRKDGKPLKRKLKNIAWFDPKDGKPNWNGIVLSDIMEAVVLGLYFTLEDADACKKRD